MADIMNVALNTMGNIKRWPAVEENSREYSFHFYVPKSIVGVNLP